MAEPERVSELVTDDETIEDGAHACDPPPRPAQPQPGSCG